MYCISEKPWYILWRGFHSFLPPEYPRNIAQRPWVPHGVIQPWMLGFKVHVKTVELQHFIWWQNPNSYGLFKPNVVLRAKPEETMMVFSIPSWKNSMFIETMWLMWVEGWTWGCLAVNHSRWRICTASTYIYIYTHITWWFFQNRFVSRNLPFGNFFGSFASSTG